MPYVPGIGDTLMQTLPKIGESLARIRNPYRDQEDLFQKLIATKPEMIDEFAQRELDSPGSLEPIFGKKVSAYVRSQPISESYKRNVQKDKLDIAGKELDITGKGTSNKRQEAGLTSDLMKNLQDSTLWDAINKDPIAKKIWEERSIGGESFDIINEKVRQVKEVSGRAKLAEPFKDKSPLEIAREFSSNPSTFPGDTLQALFERQPDAMRAAFAVLDDQSRAKLSLRLKSMDDSNQDKYLRNLMYREAIDGAQKLGINNPNAYAKKFMGKEFTELAPASTPEDDAQAEERFAQIGMNEMRNSAIKDINDMQQSLGAIGRGGLSDNDQAIQYGIINTSLQRLGEKLPAGTPIPEYRVENRKYRPDKRGWFVDEKDAHGNVINTREVKQDELLKFITDLNMKLRTGGAAVIPRFAPDSATSRLDRLR